MGKKNSVRGTRERAKKPFTEKKAPERPPFTEIDAADCAGLRRVIERANVGRVGLRNQIGPAKLARFAGPLGGSRWDTQWTGYINGRVRIPVVDRLIVCLYFPEYRPQDIFPSWPFSALTPVAAKSRIPILIHLVTALSTSSPEQQDLLTALVDVFLAASQPQREAIVHKARKILSGGSD